MAGQTTPGAGGDLGEVLKHSLDNLREGFQIIGFDFRYLYVNPEAAAHGRLSADDLQGRTMEECYPGIEQTPLFAELKRCMANRAAATLENLFTFPDGTARWFEVRIAPVPDGLCICSRDIQRRKEAEAALYRMKDQLT